MELKTYLEILSRRKWIILPVFLLLLILVFFAAQFISPKYSATARLRVKTPVGGSSSYVDFNIWYADRLMNTYADLAMSSSIREELKEQLKLLVNPDISVNVVPSSELIKITAKSESSSLSAEIANHLAEIIVAHSSEPSDKTRTATNQYLDARKTQVGEQLKSANENFQALAEPIAADKSRLDALGRTVDQDRQVYLTLKDNYEQNLSKGVEKSVLAASEKQMKELSTKIDQEQTDLEALNTQLTERLQQIEIAQREVNAKEGEFANIVALLDQAKITDIIQENTFVIPVIDPAIPPTSQSSSTKILIYILGAAVSLAGAIIIGFLVDALDTRLYTSDQIHSVTQLEFLGKIPSNHKLHHEGLAENHSAYREAIRRLRLNISRIANADHLKSIIFCSADPREGKSTLVCSLAVEFASAGRHIILIDADLRKPSIHTHINLTNDLGLSNYLAGDAELKDIVTRTEHQNLDVITSGPMPPDPAAILSSASLADLLDQLEASYDLVLIDTPAILAVSDVDEIALVVDGAILVVDRSQAEEPKLRATIRLFNNLKIKPIGMIINRAESNGTYHYYSSGRKSLHLRAYQQWLSRLKTYFAHYGRS